MSEQIIYECADNLLKISKQLRSVDPLLSDLSLWLSDKVLKKIEGKNQEMPIAPETVNEIQQLVNRIKGDCECQDCECQK